MRNEVQKGRITSITRVGCQARGARAMAYATGKPTSSASAVEIAAILRLFA